MKRVKLVVAYDGSSYHGWQYQPNGISIEEVLNETLTALLKEPVTIIGASRTDSGVHARGNVAVFDTENRMPAEKICMALNQRLPDAIRIQSSEEVPEGWHPRKQNCIKTYEYKILNRKIEMPIGRAYAHFCYFPIDLEKMQQAAAFLVGEHDFKSFCTVRTQAEETVRTIYSLELTKDEYGLITMRICGSGFLYNMVRIIAGTLLRVGTGLYEPEHVKEILAARDRQAAGPTLPARGLTLVSLDYETELRPEISGTNEDWDYTLIQREVVPKGKAYLLIRRCVDGELPGLVKRVVHQAVRNGAAHVYVTDQEAGKNRLAAGQTYGFYTLGEAFSFWRMEKPFGSMQQKQSGDHLPGSHPASAANTDGQPMTAVEEKETGLAALVLQNPEEMSAWIATQNRNFFEVSGSATYTEEMVRAEAAEGSHFMWILQGGIRVGTFVWCQEENSLYIDMISISPEFQKKGVAMAALQCAEGLAEAQAFSSLSLLAADTNLPAVGLYEKLGFRKTELRTTWYHTEGNLWK